MSRVYGSGSCAQFLFGVPNADSRLHLQVLYDVGIMSEKEPDDPTLGQSVLNSDSKSDTEGTIDSTVNDSLKETRSSTTGSSDVTETLEQHPTQEIDVKNEITPQGEVNRYYFKSVFSVFINTHSVANGG